ncbi:hypothetical protein JD523_20210 [Aeromonas enteropelogenes]|uniref:hypothetical protein n=1 Tax=Aeromonas enteropelogenes TaxID=29489 RepID=UPI00191F6F81|nr:hypothetical protein [Aeromonas enteropelogenes]MBL0523184.1 hypothetical protein [Aeromonas enteropelogenes]
MGDCPHCGKKADSYDFDLAIGTGPNCRWPAIIDPSVGGWVCRYKPPKEVDGVPQLVACERREARVCPVCEKVHMLDQFIDGELRCNGCGNTIKLDGDHGEQDKER